MIDSIENDVAMSTYVWGALAMQYPKEAAIASRLAEKTMDTMERNAKKLPAFSIEEVCYWVKLATYAHIIVDGIKEHWIREE
jgi:isochorismate hydrolase